MERSCGTMKITADVASDRYIELEKLYKEIGKEIKETLDHRKLKKLRFKRKLIRAEQNMLYPYMVNTGYVAYTEHILGLKGNQALYGRYIRGKKC